MHEETLLRDLRRKLDQISRDEGVERITQVRIRVGALCHITPETLRSRWSALVAGSAASGATLKVEASADPHDPRAQDVILVDVAVTDAEPKRSA
jgi:hydrogenase nickel incorporation protein HypA/HybF